MSAKANVGKRRRCSPDCPDGQISQAVFRARHPLAVPGNAKTRFNGKSNLLNQFNVIWAVQSWMKKYSDLQK
jgi:hypothetical protein